MTGRIGVLIILATLSLTASWMLGYREGQQTGAFSLLHQMGAENDKKNENDKNAGVDKGRDQVCDEIRRYKESMARDLDENTQICGWPDMDDPQNSN